MTVKGRHIKHCAYNNMLLDVFTSGGAMTTPQEHWNLIVPTLYFNNGFSFSSAIVTTARMKTGWSRAGTLGDFLKEMAQVFGGEFYYDNFNISFMQRLGGKKNYVLRWNRNITDPKLTLRRVLSRAFSTKVVLLFLLTKNKTFDRVNQLFN